MTTGLENRKSDGKKVILAEPRGFRAGVRKAIEIVERALEIHGAPVYVRKQIAHNEHVVRRLEARGARFVDSETEVPDGAVCIFSAHGVSPQVRDNAAQRRLTVIDATCPLVAKVHQEARRFARDERTLILVGHADHEEIEGTYGEAPDRTVIVENAEEARRLDLPPGTPVAYLTQTTLSVDATAEIVSVLRERFPGLAGPGSEDTAGLEGLDVPLRVAVMGCVVNGPGEAPEAKIVETLIDEAMRLAGEITRDGQTPTGKPQIIIT
jgi:(E)-4-hydroxy-3-methyl-but-2-enyl pyrophosphate reductase